MCNNAFDKIAQPWYTEDIKNPPSGKDGNSNLIEFLDKEEEYRHYHDDFPKVVHHVPP